MQRPSFFRNLFRLEKPEIDSIFQAKDVSSKKPGLLLLSKKKNEDPGRLIFIISKKVAKASKRNLARRRIKHIFFQNQFFRKPYDTVVLALNPTKDNKSKNPSFLDLENLSFALKSHFEKLPEKS